MKIWPVYTHLPKKQKWVVLSVILHQKLETLKFCTRYIKRSFGSLMSQELFYVVHYDGLHQKITENDPYTYPLKIPEKYLLSTKAPALGGCKTHVHQIVGADT